MASMAGFKPKFGGGMAKGKVSDVADEESPAEDTASGEEDDDEELGQMAIKAMRAGDGASFCEYIRQISGK